MRLALALALATFVQLQPTTALACKCVPPPGSFITESGKQPANVGGVAWFAPGGGAPSATVFKVERAQGTDWKAARFEVSSTKEAPTVWLIQPSWKKGERYRFSAGEKVAPVEIEVVDPFPDTTVKSPMNLGAPKMDPALWVERRDGSCSAAVVAATRALKLTLPGDLAPFRGQLLFETLVDEKPWRPSATSCDEVAPGRSWTALGTELVYAPCKGPGLGDLAQGKHKVGMWASWPNGRAAAGSGMVEIELVCP